MIDLRISLHMIAFFGKPYVNNITSQPLSQRRGNDFLSAGVSLFYINIIGMVFYEGVSVSLFPLKQFSSH